VTVNGLSHTADLAITDIRNQEIKYDLIKSTDIQNTLQRAFAKAIAMHGIGLYVYRGEDFPEDIGDKSNDAPRTKAVTQNTQKKALSSKTDICPACSTQAEPSDIKHGEKDGRKWHKASCECGEDFWIPDSFISTI